MNARRLALVAALLCACSRREPPTPPPVAPASSDAAARSTAPAASAPTSERRLSQPIDSSARAPAAAVASAEIAGPEVANQGGLRGLVAALAEVEHIELVRWDPPAPADALTADDRARLLDLVRRGQLVDTHTVAHPPWPAAFVFHTRKHGAYAVTLVGARNLRLSPAQRDGRFTGDAARWNDSAPPEMVLDDRDDWAWRFFESRLGKTKEKEYLAPKSAPDYLELPLRP